MIPLLIITPGEATAEPYIKKFLTENSIEPYAIHRLYKTLSTVTIEQIRGLSMLLSRSSYPQAAIVYDFDSAKNEAQNAFLKTLEEESLHHILILTASHEHLVLPTVRSRCKIVKIAPSLASNDISSSLLKSSHEELIKLFAQSAKINKEHILNIIDGIFFEIHQLLSTETQSHSGELRDFYKDLIVTKKLLISNNLNPEHSFDHIIISLWKKRIFRLA